MKYQSKYFIILFLVSLIFLNLFFIVPDVLSFGKGIVQSLDKPGIWRGARFARSINFADYVLFLREQIPETGTVILPPEDVSMWTLANTPAMEFFLAPREIRNCQTLECGGGFIGADQTYILIMGLDRFPGAEIRDQETNVRMHNDTWGVYGPAPGLGGGTSFPEGLNFRLLWGEILLPLLMIPLIMALGFLAVSLVLPSLPAWSRVGIGWGLVMGAFSFGGYLLLLSGWMTELSHVLYLSLGLVLLLTAGLAHKKKASAEKILLLFGELIQPDPWLVLILFLGGLFTFLAVGSGVHATDAYVLWGAKGAGLAAEGLDGVTRGTNTTEYPLHIPLLFGLMQDAFGETLPASKLMFPVYYLSLLLVVYEYLKERMVPHFAGLSTLVLATMPVMARHARIGYANLPLTFYLVSGAVLWSWAGSRRERSSGWGARLIVGILIALAGWTRPEGLWLGTTFLLVIAGRTLRGQNRYSFREFLPVISAPVTLWLIWFFTKSTFYPEVDALEENLARAVQEIFSGRMHLSELGQILNNFFTRGLNFQAWGVTGFVFLLVGFLYLVKPGSGEKETYGFWTTGLLWTGLIIALYYVFSFDRVHELDWWLNTGFNRMIMPGMVLIWTGSALALAKFQIK